MPGSLVQKSLGPALGTCIHASLPGTQDVQLMVLGSSEFGHEGDTAESTVPRLGPLSAPSQIVLPSAKGCIQFRSGSLAWQRIWLWQLRKAELFGSCNPLWAPVTKACYIVRVAWSLCFVLSAFR